MRGAYVDIEPADFDNDEQWQYAIAMHRTLSSFVAAIALTLPTIDAVAADASLVYRKASPSVVTIQCRTPAGAVSQGSGVVTGKGEIVTNYHVVKERAGHILVTQGEQTWRAEVTGVDTEHDLALLYVLLLPNERFALPPARMRPNVPKIGEPIYAIGAPRGLEQTLSDGLISGTTHLEDRALVQMTAPISPGSSGGGLFDGHGSLLGITTMYLKDSQSLNFAVSTKAVDALRRRIAAQPTVGHGLPPQTAALSAPASNQATSCAEIDLPTPITSVLGLIVVASISGPVKTDGGLTESRLVDRVISQLRAMDVPAFTSAAEASKAGIYPVVLSIELGSMHIDDSVYYPWQLLYEVLDSTQFINGSQGYVTVWSKDNFGYGGSNVVMEQVLKAVDSYSKSLAADIQGKKQ